MSILLPERPFPVNARLELVSASNDLASPLGGATQRINRLGDKLQLVLNLPVMEYEGCGGIWDSRIEQAGRVGALCYLPRQVIRRGTKGPSGAPRVNGAGQAGMALTVDGFTPHFEMVERQPFSLIVGGVRYLHRLTVAVTANAAGQATLQFAPMLRATVPDNAVLEIDRPMIEGLPPLGYPAADVSKYGDCTFEVLTITENR